MQKPTSDDVRPNIRGDIVTLIDLALSIGWEGVREPSISRILYLAGVLYSFMYSDKRNPFSEHYHFSVEPTGPYSNDVKSSITFLDSNEYISRIKENIYALGTNPLPHISTLPDHEIKKQWMKTILYILGTYGEGKIYEFVIRDPQYQDNMERNLISEINIGPDNESLRTLNQFKSSFEESLGTKAKQIDANKYLELYFEYVFSKVLKGEIKL